MIQLNIIKRKEKKEINQKLKELGIGILQPHYYLKQSKDKIRIFTGNISPNDLLRLNFIINIENIGLYFAFSKNDEFRLSFDAALLYGKNSNKTIYLNKEEAEKWLKGENLINRWNKMGYFLIASQNEILGCGKATKKEVLNFVPKERRVYK